MMKIIEKYVYAVSILLPEKNREDIKKELTSLIWDAVDERTAGNEPDEKTVVGILKELGSPREMARKYTGEAANVISSDLTDVFWLVIRIVLPIMFILVAVGSAVDLAVEKSFNENILQWITQTVASFAGAGINAFGMITLVFIGITWVKRNKGETGSKQDWDPADLPEIPSDTDKVTVSGVVADIIFTLIVLQIFNFMPDILFFMIGGFNKPVLESHLLIFNIALIADLLFNLWMLVRHRWTLPLRIINICLGGFSLFAVAALFLDPNIFNTIKGQEQIIMGVKIGLRITIAIIGITWIVDIIGHVKNMLVRR